MYDEYTLEYTGFAAIWHQVLRGPPTHTLGLIFFCVFEVRAEQVKYYMETIVPYWSCHYHGY